MTTNLLYIVMNLLFGYLLGVLIATVIKYQNYHGPDSNDVKKMIFKDENEYFRLVPKIYICPIKESMKNI